MENEQDTTRHTKFSSTTYAKSYDVHVCMSPRPQPPILPPPASPLLYLNPPVAVRIPHSPLTNLMSQIIPTTRQPPPQHTPFAGPPPGPAHSFHSLINWASRTMPLSRPPAASRESSPASQDCARAAARDSRRAEAVNVDVDARVKGAPQARHRVLVLDAFWSLLSCIRAETPPLLPVPDAPQLLIDLQIDRVYRWRCRFSDASRQVQGR